ncbi:hypothetical protein Fmac_009591 [Flemingia macrophylla]|uniref:Uncharacterized protein n=1 Tax=Flemingia macrophylla TaxID=520843 RepID=A0ABD1N0N8_9FABA
MTKNEMKTIEIVSIIMIKLNFAQAKSNPSCVQVKPKNDSLLCDIKCNSRCAPFELFPPMYIKCYRDCQQDCDKKSMDVVYDCIVGCGLIKSIDVNKVKIGSIETEHEHDNALSGLSLLITPRDSPRQTIRLPHHRPLQMTPLAAQYPWHYNGPTLQDITKTDVQLKFH